MKSLAFGYEKTKQFDKAAEFYSKYLSSSAISEVETIEIKKKIEKFESKKKDYSDASAQDEGLIGVIMRFFGK